MRSLISGAFGRLGRPAGSFFLNFFIRSYRIPIFKLLPPGTYRGFSRVEKKKIDKFIKKKKLRTNRKFPSRFTLRITAAAAVGVPRRRARALSADMSVHVLSSLSPTAGWLDRWTCYGGERQTRRQREEADEMMGIFCRLSVYGGATVTATVRLCSKRRLWQVALFYFCIRGAYSSKA